MSPLSRRLPRLVPRRALSALLATACMAAAVPALATEATASAPHAANACGTPTPFGAGQLSEIADDLSARETVALADELGHTVAELTDAADDDALWVDSCGQMYAIDPAPSASDVQRAEQAPVAAAPAPLDETFRLNSAPDATRTLFLDFHGTVVDGTAWNRQAALGFSAANQQAFGIEPYSIDNDTSTFSDAELASVQQIWSGVAEDFAPFDVNVTTERPSREALHRGTWTDDEYGLTVLVGGGGRLVDTCRCGGIAWVDTYSMVGAQADAYQYAFVFTEGAGRSGEYLTSTVSHEAGHTLGLQHDGAGTSGYYFGRAPWSPIMGAGSGPVTQWSRGEYPDASNLQDDVATIAGHLPAIGDDHGDTVADATDLDASTPTETQTGIAQGVIGTADDVDVFSFTVDARDETTTVSAAPRALAGGNPNLKVRLDVLDADGNVLHEARNDVTHSYTTGVGGMDASWTGALEPGLHHVVVQGDSHGDGTTPGTWSRYGSLGRYSVTLGAVTSEPLSVEPLAVTAVAGRAVEAQLSSTGGNGTVTWDADALPAGVVLDSDGRLHGVPSVAADTTFQVRATSGRQQVNVDVSWTVWASSLFDVAAVQDASVTVGQTVSHRVARGESASAVPAFEACATCEWPEWATLSADGVATFTPPTAGVFRLGATVHAGGLSDEFEFVVTVADLGVTAPAATSATVGSNTSWSLDALPDGASWSLVSGPSWMSVTAAGLVSVAPSQAGRFAYRVRATSGVAGVEVQGVVTVNAAAKPHRPGKVSHSSARPTRVSATRGRAVNRSVAVRGGMSWRVESGHMPRGLRLTSTGRVTGTPQQKSTTTSVVTVVGSDARNRVTRQVTVKVAQPVKLSKVARTVSLRRGAKQTLRITASKGTAAYRYMLLGKVPEGMKFSKSAATAKVAGRPTRRGTFTFTVKVLDVNGSSAKRRMVVRVR